MNKCWRTIRNPAIGDSLTFIRTSDETGGELTEAEIELAPGGGNPRHYHGSYSERFEVLDGSLEVEIGDEKRTLSVGEQALVPPRTRHRFSNPTDRPVRFRVDLRPGDTRAEQGFRILYGLAVDGRTNEAGIPKNPSDLAVVSALTDMTAAGPLALMNPLFRFLASRARKSGLERRLIDRYCTPPAATDAVGERRE